MIGDYGHFEWRIGCTSFFDLLSFYFWVLELKRCCGCVKVRIRVRIRVRYQG